MHKRFIKSALLALVAIIVIGIPVLAAYRATYTVTDNASGSTYAMLPIRAMSNNQWMADNGFMLSTALDTTVETLGGLVRPHMVTDNSTLTAIPIEIGSQENLYFTTGNTPASSMDIIVGYGGSINVTDAANLELGDNFTVEMKGWIDTTYTTANTSFSDDFDTDDWTDVGVGVSVDAAVDERLEYDVVGGDHRSSFDIGTANISDTNWRLDFTFYPDIADAGATFGLGLFDALGDFEAFPTDAIVMHISNGCNLLLRRFDGGAIGDSATITVALDTTYYVTLERISAVEAGLSIFIDAARTTHTIGSPVTLTIPDTVIDLRYVQASNYSTATGTSKGWFDDLTLYSGANVVKDLIYKIGALRMYVGGSENITSSITGGGSATATGVSSGEHTASVNRTSLLWAPDNAMHFDGTNASNINTGGLYNSAASWWISFWFRPDSTIDNTNPAWIRLMGKYEDAQDWWSLGFMTDGTLRSYLRIGNSVKHDHISVETSWTADTWYHVIYELDAGFGGNLIINDGTPVNDATVSNLPPTGDLCIGDRDDPGDGDGFIGEIANVIVGTDVLTPAETTALYNGTAPGDETDLWYIDEGTGTNIVSYGSAANAGTADTNTSWEVSTRPTKFAIYIDGIVQDGFSRDVSVPDNANDWTFMANNSMPYADNITIITGGNRELWFQPNDMIIGTTLPDRATSVANDGTIVWGANPTGISATLGSMVSSSQPSPGITADDPTQDILPIVETSDWFIEPDVSGTLLTNPLRPFVTIMSDTTTLTELQAWRLLALAFILLVTVATARGVRGHHAITGIAAGASIGGAVTLTIFPLWALVFAIGAVVGGLISERSPSL